LGNGAPGAGNEQRASLGLPLLLWQDLRPLTPGYSYVSEGKKAKEQRGGKQVVCYVEPEAV
jgi:hypothetical protein